MFRLMHCAVFLAVIPAMALAADRDDRVRKPADTVILNDDAQGRTVGKVGGQPVILLDTASGTVGKVGKDKVLLHDNGRGTTIGKVGDRRLLCHTDAASGVTICK